MSHKPCRVLPLVAEAGRAVVGLLRCQPLTPAPKDEAHTDRCKDEWPEEGQHSATPLAEVVRACKKPADYLNVRMQCDDAAKEAEP